MVLQGMSTLSFKYTATTLILQIQFTHGEEPLDTSVSSGSSVAECTHLILLAGLGGKEEATDGNAAQVFWTGLRRNQNKPV